MMIEFDILLHRRNPKQPPGMYVSPSVNKVNKVNDPFSLNWLSSSSRPISENAILPEKIWVETNHHRNFWQDFRGPSRREQQKTVSDGICFVFHLKTKRHFSRRESGQAGIMSQLSESNLSQAYEERV